MRRVVFSAVVLMLAGSCWVLAQNASTNNWSSPYGARPAAAAKAMLPEEKAESLTAPPGEPLVAPTTQLQVTPTVESPIVAMPAIPIPPRPTTLPDPAQVIAPPPMTEVLPVPAPSTPPTIVEERPPVRITTTPALPGMPSLPPIPGVTGPAPLWPGDARPRYENVVVPPSSNAPPQWSGSEQPSVDPPAYWQERDRFNTRDAAQRKLSPPRVWGGADYLLWFTKAQSVPNLVQSITGVSTVAGAFDNAQATNLFPAGDYDYGLISGIRGTIGFWVNPQQTTGVEVSYLWFGGKDTRDRFDSTSSTVLGRPFVDATTGVDSLYQVSSPFGMPGRIDVHGSFRMEGGDANVLLNSIELGQSLNFLAGVRYLDISESLRISQVSEGAGFNVSSFDYFGTRNQFWGGQFGLRWNYQGTRISASITGKIAYGVMYQSAHINGQTTGSVDGVGSINESGGVLALTSNIGDYKRSRMAFIPEAIANIGYRVTPWATVSVGYNLLFITDMARPGAQIDPVVDQANLPFGGGSTVRRPGFSFKSEDFWAQGLNFSIALQY